MNEREMASGKREKTREEGRAEKEGRREGGRETDGNGVMRNN